MAKSPDTSPPVELDPPAEALNAKAAFEVLRAWIADGKLHVTLQAETFSHDVSEWGRMLADMSHHIARAVALGGSVTEKEAVSMIAEAFDRGVTQATTVAVGQIKGRTRH